MMAYNRKPAVIILATILGGGSILLWRTASAGANSGTDNAISQLETQIAKGHVTRETWLNYGDLLLAATRNSDAAAAYHKVLELEPSDRQGRIGYVVALARNKNVEVLSGFLRVLCDQDPKLAIALLQRPECQSLLPPPRYAALLQEAKAQAAD